eukprot:TRINITY_DN13432_c0_g1_i1.p1 TRINITY_DN13432_c0_g1~~TRINITY_DN13432_c0_g1_i1.p1  ORF type:complete len:188 (-),score=41.84 TRINITY_DN13432_c0_g1_i1:24-587(-)
MPSGDASPCMEGARSAALSKLGSKPSWYELTFEEDTDASSLSDVLSFGSTPRQSFAADVAVVIMDDKATPNAEETIQFATFSAAPLQDESEAEAPHDRDSHTTESVDGSIGSAAELSAGSASHHLGSCNPCMFMKTKLGCKIGSACYFCHYPHEELTRNSMRNQRRTKKKHYERDARAQADAEAMVA